MAITKDKLMLGFFLLLISGFVESRVFTDASNKGDPCEDSCVKIYPPPDVSNVKRSSVCYYGCRSFNLVQLISGDMNSKEINASKEACEASCMEAYSPTQDRYACNIGCGMMAKLIQAHMVVAQVSWSVYIEDGNSVLLVQPVDFEPDDVLTDPGLRKQLERNLGQGIDDDRLPQTHVRTLPVGGEVSKEVSHQLSHRLLRTDWLECASRKSGLPRLVLASIVVMAVLLALWFCLAPERHPVETVQGFDARERLAFDLPPKYSFRIEEV